MKFTKECISYKVLYIAVCVLLTLSLAACGGGNSGVAVSEIPKYTLPPVEEEELPAQGGSLKFPVPPQAAGEMNPLKISNVELHSLYTLIYEQPVRIGPDGKAQPELAQTWSVDDTGTVWTFLLREGVQWQGGYGEMTSADVIYTIGLIKSYADSDSNYAKYNSHITNYDAPDSYTVTVTLDEPGYMGVYFMTFPVVCKAYCTAGNIDDLNPLGTGPYEVTEYVPGEHMQLSINGSWWKEAPYIETLTALCYDDCDDELSDFNQNLLDFLTTSELTVDTYSNTRHEYVDYLTQYYDCLVPNTNSELFSDLNIRQAVGYAIDRRDIISKALLGHAVATDYPISPGSYLSGASSNMYEYNQEKARELLALSGWEDRDDDGICEKVAGTEIIDLSIGLLIPLNKDTTYRYDVAENIKSQLVKCGISVTITEVDTDDGSGNNSYLQKLQSGDFDMALCSFFLDNYPDVSFMIGTNGSQNYGAFSDDEMDRLLANCSSALDETAMTEAFSALEQRFIETVPQIGLYFKTSALLYDSAITVSGDVHGLSVYNTLPNWHLYTKNSSGEVAGEGTISPEASASPTATAPTSAAATDTADTGE